MPALCPTIPVIFFALLLVNTTVLASGDEDRWIDAETGRQVRKITPEAYATLPYFTANSVSVDGKSMVYISGRGLNLLDLQSFATENIVHAGLSDIRCIEMGRKGNRLFYVKRQRGNTYATLESINLNSKATIVHAQLPAGYQVESINADETLASGVFEERTLEQSIVKSPVK